MSAKVIDGKAIAAVLKGRLAEEVAEFKNRDGAPPTLEVILVGNNPASEVYVKKKAEACETVGIRSRVHRFEEKTEEYDILRLMRNILNISSTTNGILVQLPLPEHIDNYKIFDEINPLKDVDVFHPENVGLLVQGRPRFLPCTPHGVQRMLNMSGLPISGKHVVVINRSDIVGKPLSSMLIQDNDEYANATVTVCHDRTPPEELNRICSIADIIVVAVGIPGFLTSDMVRKNQIIVDVGITRVGKKLIGDVHPSVREKVEWITPVPNGIGPMTVVMLLENTLKAAKLQNGYE